MVVQTQHIDFVIPTIQNEDESNQLTEKIIKVLNSYLLNLKILLNTKIGDSSYLKIYINENDTILTVRVFYNGHLNLTIEYDDCKQTLFTFEDAEVIERLIIKEIDNVQRSQTLCPIRRGEIRYLRSSDQRIFEYDIDETLFQKTTNYQKIQILHSKTFGNMLVLDGLQNLAESDLIYTESLMQKGKINYKDKEILILGGGDGALLYEILKEKPKFVTMIEIDEDVMKACNKFLKSVCGDVLEKMRAENFEIIVDDCVKYLEKYISQNKKFDYVFGDLTDIPISLNSCEIWGFINKILDLSFKVLKNDGKYLSHGNGVNCQSALDLYEAQLKKISPDIKWDKTVSYVPSFMEDWVFYIVNFQ